MRLFLLTLFCTAANWCLSQSHYTYTFEVNGITGLAQAKAVIEVVEPVFDGRPTFNDGVDRFSVESEVTIVEAKLRSKLLHNGWVLTGFTRDLPAARPK
jgi:hypothetical protein